MNEALYERHLEEQEQDEVKWEDPLYQAGRREGRDEAEREEKVRRDRRTGRILFALFLLLPLQPLIARLLG